MTHSKHPTQTVGGGYSVLAAVFRYLWSVHSCRNLDELGMEGKEGGGWRLAGVSAAVD